jgi:hypothetical protein
MVSFSFTGQLMTLRATPKFANLGMNSANTLMQRTSLWHLSVVKSLAKMLLRKTVQGL